MLYICYMYIYYVYISYFIRFLETPIVLSPISMYYVNLPLFAFSGCQEYAVPEGPASRFFYWKYKSMRLRDFENLESVSQKVSEILRVQKHCF